MLKKETFKKIKKKVKIIDKEVKILDQEVKILDKQIKSKPKTKKKLKKAKEVKKIVKEIEKINKELKHINPNFKGIKIQKKHKIKRGINWENIFIIIRRIVMIALSLFILLVGLDLLKKSIISDFNLDFFSAFFSKPIKSFFLSYLMTAVTMSGSPIAGTFISLGDILNINQNNLAAIIMGTRGGVNSFLLITGLLMLLKGKSLKRSLGITVIQFLVTLSTTLVSAIFIFYIIKSNTLHNISEYLLGLNHYSGLDTIVSYFSKLIQTNIHKPIFNAVLGLGLLIGGLFMFDRSFSFLAHGKDRKFIHKMIGVYTSFIFGFLITSVTMSLSISITILMPLYIRKVINRKMLIAYILGANISTLFDTLFLAIVSGSLMGVQTILGFIIAVSIAVIILMILFKPFQHIISEATDRILSSKYSFILFLIIVLLSPFIMFLF